MKKYSNKNKIPVISIIIVAVFVVLGVIGQYIVPYDALEAHIESKLIPPFFMEGGSLQHILGTDELGRDVLSRVIVGGRVSLVVALAAILVGGIFGTLLGIIAGYYGKTADTIISRLTDASLAFPSILLALLLSISIGPGEKAAIISIAFSMWAKYTRTIKGEVVLLKQSNFVAQTKIMGANNGRIIWKHILPNLKHILVIMLSLEVGMAIITEASLSFLGLSVVAPTPSWGNMIADGKNYFLAGWWVALFPSIATILTALSLQKVGDWLKKFYR